MCECSAHEGYRTRREVPQASIEPNREFLSLWLRFLVGVAMYSRQRGAQDLLVPRTPANADVRRTARRLATNASLHGYGIAQVAARLSVEVERMTSLLSDPEIEMSFGARDMWSAVDQVNRLYLDGAVNVARYRTQAQAGRVVLQWLAANADRLGAADTTAPGGTPGAGASASNEDLANATEQWLGASGVADELIDEYSQPGESPTLICPPVDLPAIAQDLLGAVGMLAGGLAGSDAAERLRGVVALFHGAAGTGKTLAAHVLAAALSRDIVRVDLSRVVSRYIGETEKNLDAIFAQAERTGAVLFFDEADALFDRRTEVKDSHDRASQGRPSNLDVAALLKRIERYEGVVVLAINVLPKEIEAEADDAQSDNDRRRRLRQVVRFPRSRH